MEYEFGADAGGVTKLECDLLADRDFETWIKTLPPGYTKVEIQRPKSKSLELAPAETRMKNREIKHQAKAKNKPYPGDESLWKTNIPRI
jgi:hypothetical protein